MTAWLLDDGPFGELAREFDAGWNWPANTIHLVYEVADAAKTDRSGRRQKLLALGTPPAAAVKVHRTLANSAVARYVFTHLRPDARSATKNLGEDVAIALAAIDLPDVVFVTFDKQAAFIALAELGPGRVATPLDVWHDLQTRALITDSQREQLVKRTIKQSVLPSIPRRFAPPAP